MGQLKETAITHLSLFASNEKTGDPLTRMPVYAEIALAKPEEAAPIDLDQRFAEPAGAALEQSDPAAWNDPGARQRVTEAALEALSRELPAQSREQLLQNNADLMGFLRKVVRQAQEPAGRDSLADLAAGDLLDALRKAVRSVADGLVLPLNPQAAPDMRLTWAYPLGMLATDHAGYLSYDLTRLPPEITAALREAVAQRRADPSAQLPIAVYVYPLQLPEVHIEALAQGRFTDDAILLRLSLAIPKLPALLRNMGLPAMQKPSLTDWRLSGASFAANPASMLGEDGCENLLPANLALQEYNFYQVVRLADRQGSLPPGVRNTVQLGFTNDYSLTWYPLGHSLGQILYSLPLAPGESVNLTVVDWTRRDRAQRQEDTRLTEQLVHEEHRDRQISETVDAALQELQHGSSFMGGLAQSVGASIPLGKAGIAAGLAGSLGGSTATSDGARNLTANTVQKVSDNITQASSAARELQSTVVVQTTQEEKEAIETRTVVNYNHSHALTILYYEVLRHYRVVTRLTRRTPALLVRYETKSFSVYQQLGRLQNRTFSPFLWDNRQILKPNLLEDRYAAAFDALERIEGRKKAAAHTPVVKAFDQGDIEFTYFVISFHTGGLNNFRTDVKAEVFDTTPKRIAHLKRANDNSGSINYFGAFGQNDYTYPFYAVTENLVPVKWRDIGAFNLVLDPANDIPIGITSVNVKASDVKGHTQELVNWSGDVIISQATGLVLEAAHPPALPPPPAPTPEEINDQVQLDELLDHLDNHKEYYNRLVWLNEDPQQRAGRFDGMKWDGSSSLLDHLENRAVEVIGSSVAFPSTDGALNAVIQALEAGEMRAMLPPDLPLDERLVTLPTRGVFAEAKLGSCNASEEIDNTRFWDWQQSPIPHWAPEIAPATPVTPQPQQQNLSPTAFPQSLVNIVNPPNAPDPTGLAAALTTLATPNIFRDMSGRAEVADLLKRLSDNSIKIAEASDKARGILANQAANAASGGGGTAGTGGAAGGGGARAGGGGGSAGGGAGGGSQPMSPDEQHDRIQVVRNAVDQGNITPEQGNQKIDKILDAGTPQGNNLQVILSNNSPELRSFTPPDKSGETILGVDLGGDVPKDARYQWHEDLHLVKLEFPKGALGMTAIAKALKPGVTKIGFEVFDAGGVNLLGSASIPLSVPQFVEVNGTDDLDPVFASWHLGGRKADLLIAAQKVAEELLSVANIRTVWTVSPIGEKLPAQFGAGGEAEGNLSMIWLCNTSRSNAFIDRGGTPSASTYNEISGINLGRLVQEEDYFKALIDRLGSLAAPDPALEDFVVKLIARYIGRVCAYEIRTMVLGNIFPSGASFADVQMVDMTGFTYADGADKADPASYTDHGTEPMKFYPVVVERFNANFPVPPAFK